MGTSGAYGGSKATTWKKVREEWIGLPGAASGNGSDGDPEAESPDEAPAAFDALGQALADALLKDAGKESSGPIPPLSTFLRRARSSGGNGGGAGGGGVTGSPSSRGRSGGRRGRHAALQAGKGGAAIGAAWAYRNRDAGALAEFGIRMEDLDGLPPRTQCAKLLALVLGDDGHPDEAAVRRASAEQVKKVLEGAVPTALEALRGFIGELTFQFCKVELTNRILGGASTSKEATAKERGLRQWIKAKIKTLDLGKYGSITATQCYAAAQTMFRDAQRLLSAR